MATEDRLCRIKKVGLDRWIEKEAGEIRKNILQVNLLWARVKRLRGFYNKRYLITTMPLKAHGAQVMRTRLAVVEVKYHWLRKQGKSERRIYGQSRSF
jgi:hypothetical protein